MDDAIVGISDRRLSVLATASVDSDLPFSRACGMVDAMREARQRGCSSHPQLASFKRIDQKHRWLRHPVHCQRIPTDLRRRSSGSGSCSADRTVRIQRVSSQPSMAEEFIRTMTFVIAGFVRIESLPS